jgi:hypothetical protein
MSDKMQVFGYDIAGGREHQLDDGTPYPVSPFVTITLKFDGVSASISPPLATESEIESYFAKLIENAEAVSRLSIGQLRLAR